MSPASRGRAQAGGAAAAGEPGAREAPPQWRPRGDRGRWAQRAAVIASVRSFFEERGVLEVDTPILGARGAMEPTIASFSTSGPDGRIRWLQTSPEYAMKRMLAAGSGPIFQICRAFRAGESGPRHNPEFTLLEWYRPGFDHHRLMDETGVLADAVLGCGRPRRIGYAEAFRRLAGVEVGSDPTAVLREQARRTGADASTAAGLDRDGCLDLLLTQRVQPRLADLAGTRAVFLYDYPASQAALARVRRTAAGAHAERFELFIDGVEVANGYHELTDPCEQRRRFAREAARRRQAGLPPMEVDERLLAALAHGLPQCAGVALGLDRLVMLALGVPSLEDAMVFPDRIA